MTEDTYRRMQDEIERLREALAPFAKFNAGLLASMTHGKTYDATFYSIENKAGVFELQLADFQRAADAHK